MKQNQWLTGTLLFFFISCNPADKKEQKNISPYFDLKGYTETEAVRLRHKNPVINKTVSISASAETKSLKITDWAKELAALTDADINKTAWKGLFNIQKLKNGTIYRCEDDKVPVKEIRLWYKDNNLKGLRVLIKNSNLLYTSTDSIFYYPDSLYEMRKDQKIRLLSPKKYRISVKFN